MAHAENSIVINKPAGEVYSFLADGLNNPTWRTGIISISLSKDEAGHMGAEYKQEMNGPGRRKIDGDYRITRAQEDKELGFAVIAGPARPEGKYLLEAVPGGTKVVFVPDFQPTGFMKLMNGMIAKTMQSEVASLSSLEKVLDG